MPESESNNEREYGESKPDELMPRFQQFYRRYYKDELGELAQRYPNEQRALYVDYRDLYQYDDDLADKLLSQGNQIREYAEEALAKYDLPVDISFNRAEFRPTNLTDENQFDVGDYRTKHLNSLLAIKGEVVACEEVKPFAEEAAFECQRCGTLTYIPQHGFDMQEPHECPGCEEDGPFNLNFDQSELVDFRQFTLEAVDSNLEDPPTLDASVKEDLVDKVGPGDYLTAVGVLEAKSEASSGNKSTVLDYYVDVWNIEKAVDGEADALSASDLREKITEYVEAEQGGGEFGVSQDDVFAHFSAEYGQRRKDIETQIENLVEDDSSPIDEIAGGEKLMHQ